MNIDNYEKLETIIELYSEFKEEMNKSLSEFLKLSAKYDLDDDFLHQTLELFQKHRDRLPYSYGNFLENTEANVDNYGSLESTITLLSEYVQEEKITISEFSEYL